MLDAKELARHLVEHKGRCHMSGDYCKPLGCPVYKVCNIIDKHDWAKSVLDSQGPEGKCESIW